MDAVKKKQKAVTFGQFEKDLKYINAVDAGFIYRISFKINLRWYTYIGQKHYRKWDAKKHCWVDSDWKTYLSSSKSLKALIKYATDVQYEIITECMSSHGLHCAEAKAIKAEWASNKINNINLQVGQNLRRPDYFDMQKHINIVLDACIRRANYVTVIAGEK